MGNANKKVTRETFLLIYFRSDQFFMQVRQKWVQMLWQPTIFHIRLKLNEYTIIIWNMTLGQSSRQPPMFRRYKLPLPLRQR
jgi:hypothetical protein